MIPNLNNPDLDSSGTARFNRLSMKKRITIPIVLLILFTLSGCGNLGTAVVLWPSDDSRWKPGDLLTVKDESFLRNTYIVNLPEKRRLKEEIDQWRLKLFRKEKDAVNFASAMGEWQFVYGECLYQGLPMRSEPSNTSSRIFRFRKGDFIKVLGREPGPVPVGNLEGYWYHVIAEGGIEGYVFDYYLKVMRIKDGETIVLNARSTDDPVLDNILADAWRPSMFTDMINDSQIDLALFKPEYGLFPDREEQTLTLRLPESSIVQTWTEIVPAGPKRYDFLGTSFRITVNSEYFISVQYNADGKEHFEAFVRFGRSIPDIIAGEQNRREAVLEHLLEIGPVFGSRAYGELAFYEDGSFTWSGKSSLISRGIISSSAGNKGLIKFNYFKSPEISGAHEGVLNLRFDNGETVQFLYAFEDDGLRLLYVPENVIQDRRVKTDQFIDPVRLFFKPLDGVVLPER
ncbi:MAG: hypothetical protein DRP70_02730 [Spirochaetes bacterium]|nr:MAG: hypothetical protein DRP70_02730 [Spirochaetota bacterium]RKX98952.1 MAG: hypothetical protein DRZ90_00825 [Spirochaetota bacterium]